jgi:cytochrome c oxidase subunit 3
MTQDPLDPPPHIEKPGDLRDKSEIRIPGAGKMGMMLLLMSLSMIFGATIVLYLLFRSGVLGKKWEINPNLHLPGSLWISTVIIVISSFTVQHALIAIRKDQEKSAATALWITFALGSVFLALQVFNWYEVITQLRLQEAQQTFAIAFFYIFTSTHAAHVIGGLLPMAITAVKTKNGRYSRNFHPGIRYTVVYWHFLDIVWIILFLLMLTA